MKICLVAPGIMEIPPQKWGAVEMMLWDYFNILTSLGHDVEILNIPEKQEIIRKVNAGGFDAVHVHYDVFAQIMPFLNAKVKILSSHYPFISEPRNYIQDGYNSILPDIVRNIDFHIFASSQKDIDTFVSFGANRDNTFLSKLGVRSEPYNYQGSPTFDKTLCFSQIVDRKRQYLIQDFEDVIFSGQLRDPKFSNHKNYHGELPRDILNYEITKFSNFTLLSSVENTTPLAVKEALTCGLGVVVSEAVAQELDTLLPFISVIPECLMQDKEYIGNILKENRAISRAMRPQIREYAIKTFGLESILENSYIKKIESLMP